MKAVSMHGRSAFSLIEVVIATAIFAGAIVAVVGLLSPMTARIDDVVDSELAARLAGSIQVELENLGFSTAEFLTRSDDILLVANVSGTRVCVENGDTPAANNNLDDELPGIAERDRYFSITISRQSGSLNFEAANSGSLALHAKVVWPYKIPVGPPTPGNRVASGLGADSHTVVPNAQTQSLVYFFAVRP